MQKILDYFEFLSVAFLGFSIAYLISSAVSLKYPSISPVKFGSLNCPTTFSWNFTLSVARDGFFQPESSTAGVTVPVMEETFSLGDYSLKGTIVCSQCSHSIAILEKNDKSEIVSVGQEIHGYKLERVYPDRAVFSNGSREVILILKSLKEKAISNSNKVEFTNSLTKTFTVNRKEIIDQISSGDFLRFINIVPVKDPSGLKVNYVSPRSFIYKLGIRPGDVILSINDIRIRTPEDSFSAFEQLKNADSITVVVLRNGKEVKLHYELE